MIDLHTHHDRRGHAKGGLTDGAGLNTQMAHSAWDSYLAEVAVLGAELAGRLDLRVGIETDYLPGTEAVYRPELDYVLGGTRPLPNRRLARRRARSGSVRSPS